MRHYLLIIIIGIVITVSLASCGPAVGTPTAKSSIATSTSTSIIPASGFLHVLGQQIVDINDNPVYLRGVNMDTFYYIYN